MSHDKLHDEDQGQGQLPESQGRYFYDIFNVLGYLAAQDINTQNAKSLRTMSDGVLTWHRDMQRIPTEVKLRVSGEILGNHANIVSSLTSKKVLKQIKAHLGRRMTNKDLRYMRSWKRHVVDDFFMVGFVKRGGVFVQMYETEDGSGVENVFVVKGLADSLGAAMGGMQRHCMQQLGWKYGVVHAALVPSPDNKAITYLGAMSIASSRRWCKLSPSGHDAMFARAEGAYARAVEAGAVLYSLEDDTLTKSPVIAKHGTGVSGPLESAILSAKGCTPNNTTVNVLLMCWIPTKLGTKDPNFLQLQKDVYYTRPSILEGFKMGAQLSQVYSDDNSPCPMCYGGGWGSSLREHSVDSQNVAHFSQCKGSRKNSPSFKNCCKAKYMKLQNRSSAKTQQPVLFMMNPIPMHITDAMMKLNVDPTMMNLFDIQRCGPKEVRTLTVSLPNREQLDVVRNRLHNADCFHATSNSKWDFIGYCPLTLPQGILTYGDVSIDDDKLQLEYIAMTSGRAEILIAEIINLCSDLNPFDAKVQLDKASKQKLDKTAIARTRRLLEHWMARNGSHVASDSIVKTHIERLCRYCNSPAPKDGKLLRCSACEEAKYCDPSCQRAHWKFHKGRCKEVQKLKKEKQKKKKT